MKDRDDRVTPQRWRWEEPDGSTTEIGFDAARGSWWFWRFWAVEDAAPIPYRDLPRREVDGLDDLDAEVGLWPGLRAELESVPTAGALINAGEGLGL